MSLVREETEGARSVEPPTMRTGAVAFFVVALGWSTACWLASARWSAAPEPAASPLFLLGGAGPCIAAVASTLLREPAATRRDFWLRIVDPRRIGWPWWIAALLLHPAIVAGAVLGDLALGRSAPVFEPGLDSIAALLGLAGFVFWFGPLPEEIGWRGFALDRLLRRLPALPASLVLGLVWALWHLPLFFVPGTFQAGLGLGSPRSWIFLAALAPLSVVMTWIYGRTARSTLAAVLVHFSGNLCGAVVAKTDRTALLELVLLVLVAALVSFERGPRRVSGRGRARGPAGALEKIVSGGQTGADRAALDVALALGLEVGGWVPRGRRAEDGRIPDRYPGLAETDSDDPAIRTVRNVRDSDATLVLSHGPLCGGSLLTLREARRAGRPALHLDLDVLSETSAAERLRAWLEELRIATLNVAGPRASEDPAIAASTAAVLRAALRHCQPAAGDAHGRGGVVP
jgi:membrane protease YdiL (CAAX protease family)